MKAQRINFDELGLSESIDSIPIAPVLFLFFLVTASAHKHTFYPIVRDGSPGELPQGLE